jgi:hypothetical protein
MMGLRIGTTKRSTAPAMSGSLRIEGLNAQLPTPNHQPPTPHGVVVWELEVVVGSWALEL